MAPPRQARIRVAEATAEDREAIYRIRHEIYARELGQHAENEAGRLEDALDAHNVYLVATVGSELAGFVSITPPSAPSYSIDKYLSRDALPFDCDERLYEMRILSVREPFRGQPIAFLLLYACYRWVESRGGDRIVGIGRDEIKDIYLKTGGQALGIGVQSGAVHFELILGRIADCRALEPRFERLLERLEQRVDWQLDMPFRRPAACFHGGAFFSAVGERFDDLGRRHGIVNADVLDAWFPPAPGVVETLREHLPWLARSSPPTHCEGMVATIAERRGLSPEAILPGAGSSSLIYLAFRHWLDARSRVLILDPMYGEYEHLLEQVIGCQVDRLPLEASEDYALDPRALAERIGAPGRYDLVALVNPNSPTGRHLPRPALEAVLDGAARGTRVWIDETYVEYAGAEASLERYAQRSDRVFVCKSMSKVYALSGLRAAYLCGPPARITPLREISPPWAVSLPGQLAAVKALEDPDYYAARYAQTHALRAELAAGLAALPGLRVFPSTTNFLLLQLPEAGPSAAELVARCQARGLYLRDVSSMGQRFGRHSLRTAVKDAEQNQRIVEVLGEELLAGAYSAAALP